MPQSGWRRFALSLGGLLALLGIICWGVVALEPFRHEGTSFEVPESCSALPNGGPSRNAVASDWKAGTLTIRTSVCINCGARVETVTGQVLGDRVLLKIRAVEKAHAQCDCEHPLVVRLAELPQRDYKIMGIPTYTSCGEALPPIRSKQ